MQSLRVLPRLPTSYIGLRSIKACTQLRTATSSSTTSVPVPARRSVTITNDTGRVPWSELSWRERGARTTQQSANLGVVILGIVMTGGVATVLWLEVFSGDSKTAVYNRAFERIRNDPTCIDVLAGRGKGGEIEAWGENRVRNSRFARDTIS
jgi:import inner membrane translocase subunit TIM21